MSCPICTSPEGSTIAEGVRAGAAVLVLSATIVIGCIARFAFRLWRSEQRA